MRLGAPHPVRGVRFVVEGERTTAVIVPIDMYERLLEKIEAHELVAQLDDPKTEWTKAEDAALEIVGSWIAKARRHSGLTQKQLAAKLGMAQSQVSRIEKHPDRSTIKTMRRIAAALGIDIATLLSFASPDT